MRHFLALLIGLAVLVGSVPAFANGRQDYIPTLDAPLRRQIQTALRRQGFFPGPINGVIGPASRVAIRRFRVARGIGNERIDNGDGTFEDLTLYLTPALIKELFHVDVGSGTEELTVCQLLQVMRAIGITPGRNYANYVSPDDEGHVICPPAAAPPRP
jgi:peptidoglycan hydrolase-like protein with peptidoglycan-binding domain